MFYYIFLKQEEGGILRLPFDKYEAKIGDVLEKSVEQFVAGYGFHCMRHPLHTKEIPMSVCDGYVICEVKILGKLDWDGSKSILTVNKWTGRVCYEWWINGKRVDKTKTV